MQSDAFRQNSSYLIEQGPKQSANPLDRAMEAGTSASPLAGKAKKKSGGIWQGVKSAAGSVAKAAIDNPVTQTVFEAADVPARYTLRPVMGAAAYLGAEERVDPRTGQTYTESPSWTDIGQGFKELLTQNPLDSYMEGKKAFEGRLRDPKLTAGGRIALGAASDPLTYVGPGAAKSVLARAPAAIRKSDVARVGAAIVESPRAVSAGSVAGSALAAEGAERAGLGPTGQTAAALAGGLAGGLAAPRAGRALKAAGEGLATVQGRKGLSPAFGLSIEDITKNPKRAGRETTIKGNQGDYKFRYRLVDLGDITPSHDPFEYTENPNYLQSIQPRDRGSAAGRIQVEGIGRDLDPERLLAETGDLQNGIPIIGPDGLVESGNGRTMGTIRAARFRPQDYAAYVKRLHEKLPDYGIDPDEIATMERPFLVRERVSEVPNRQAFADEANASSVLRMGVSEIARSDARLITDQLIATLEVPETGSLDNVLLSASSRQFVREWLARMAPNEAGALIDAEGHLNAAGLNRLKAALFSKTYAGPAGDRLLGEFFESADPNVRLIKGAIESTLARVAKLEAAIRDGKLPPKMSMTEAIAEAADKYAALRREGMRVTNYLGQGTMFGADISPEARAVLAIMGDNPRSGRPLREAIRAYVASALDPSRPMAGQQDMFGGEAQFPSFMELWEEASGRFAPDMAPEALIGAQPNPEAVPEVTPAAAPEAPEVTPEVTPEAVPEADAAASYWERRGDRIEFTPENRAALDAMDEEALRKRVVELGKAIAKVETGSEEWHDLNFQIKAYSQELIDRAFRAGETDVKAPWAKRHPGVRFQAGDTVEIEGEMYRITGVRPGLDYDAPTAAPRSNTYTQYDAKPVTGAEKGAEYWVTVHDDGRASVHTMRKDGRGYGGGAAYDWRPVTVGGKPFSIPSKDVSPPLARTSPSETSAPQTSPGGVTEPAASTASIKAAKSSRPKVASASATASEASIDASIMGESVPPSGRLFRRSDARPFSETFTAAAAGYRDDAGNVIESSRFNPAQPDDFKVGQIFIDDEWLSPSGRQLYRLEEFDPDQLTLTETPSPDRVADVERYAAWAREGKVPPPVRVARAENGELRVVDGHRRVLAAKAAGTKVRALVSELVDSPTLRDTDGNPIKVPLTDRLLRRQQMLEQRASRRQSQPEPQAAPEPKPAPEPKARRGRLPRPAGEPETIPAPGGERGVVGVQRGQAPEGYAYGVPEGEGPRYRRTQTGESLELQKAKPVPKPLDPESRITYKGEVPDIADAFGADVATYHPQLGQPYARQGSDYRRLRSAARQAFRREYIRENLPEDVKLKDLSEEERKELLASASAFARREVKAVEDEVLREGFWTPLDESGSRGEGVPQGRPSGAPGTTPGEPPLIPPDGPPKEPPMPRGRGGTQPFGRQEDRDLFKTLTREREIAKARTREGSQSVQTWRKLKAIFGHLDSETETTKVDPFIRVKRRLDSQIQHIAEGFVTMERAILKASGLEARDVDGTYHLFADGRDVGIFDDVIEGTSDAGRAGRTELSEIQNRALDVIAEHNEALNGNIRYHGGEPRIDETIEGDYFGRRVISRIVETKGGTKTIEKAQGMIQSRKVGAERVKSRVIENVETLRDMGFRLDDPWAARLAITRGKLMTAQDAYLARNLKPLQVRNPGSTFGLATVAEHPAFTNTWFDPKVARRIQKGLETRPRYAIPGVKALNSVLTPLRASFDLSASLQQGLRLWLTEPHTAAAFQWEIMRSLKDPDIYDKMLLRLNAEGPGLDYLTSVGLRFTGDIAHEEFAFSPGLIEKLRSSKNPLGKVFGKGMETSSAHFDRTLNAYRLHMANNQYKRLVAAGLEGSELDEAMKASTAGINRAFGWTYSKPTSIEDAALFAPRYTRAAVETLFKAFERGTIEGAMARQHMGLMLAEGAALVFVLNTARGEETEFDPRDPNFLRIRDVGGVDVTPFGTYNTLFRTVAEIAAGREGENPVKGRIASQWRFLEGKMSPGLKLAYEPFIKRETYLGEPLDPFGSYEGAWRTIVAESTSTVPFGLQNLIQEGPVSAVVGSLGVGNTPLTPAERRDRARASVANKLFGTEDYESLSGEQKSQVNSDERVAKWQEEVDKRSLRSSGDSGRATAIRRQVEEELAAAAADLERGTDEAGNPFTGNDFRKAYSDTMLRAAGARAMLDNPPGDADVDGWFDLFKQSTMANGQINYDLLERLQADYRTKHAGIDEKVDRAVGIRDNPTTRELREAKKLAAAYYDIPGYRGMSVAESERAASIIAMANDMVSFGQARNRADALRRLASYDSEGVRLARRATNAGPNPAREKFRKSNPLFAKYYSDVAPALLK